MPKACPKGNKTNNKGRHHQNLDCELDLFVTYYASKSGLKAKVKSNLHVNLIFEDG